jgi:arylsulfatase A-like enzyme
MPAPNILFLMTDQMQGRVLDSAHPCITPNFDRLAARGVRLPKAYTPNAVCSPARASLMTGRLPHTHGVLEVIHCVDADQCNLRTELPHWAQQLAAADYRTGYFGKWHVERSEDLTRFGWQVNGSSASPLFAAHKAAVATTRPATFSLRGTNDHPEGYAESLLYGVTDVPPAQRGVGMTTDLALGFLQEQAAGQAPWCCFVSVTEPHDPFVCGEEAFALYDVEDVELPANIDNDLHDQPGLYRKAGLTWQGMSQRQKQEAAVCYWASITEIDAQYGRLLDYLESSAQLDNTIVVLSSDHGELLGAHGMYCKNVSGFEEVYSIPMVLSGPGIQQGVVSDARVGLHDVCPTILELSGLDLPGDTTIGAPDSQSFAPALRDVSGAAGEFTRGFAEYHGGRYRLTQRVIWDGPWKLCWNGFDFDELYNLDEDRYEMHNRIHDDNADDHVRRLMSYAWEVVRDTADTALLNSQYPILRLAPYGPELP